MGKDQTRRFVVTNWNLETNYQSLIDDGQIRWIAYGDEVCPKTGTPHHQCYLYMWNQWSKGVKTLDKVGKMFGEKHANVQVQIGSFKENKAYCSKEGTYNTYGKEPAQGFREDLKETKDLILSGKLTVDDIVLTEPELFHQYGRTLERIESIALRKRFRSQMTEGIWITGPSGAGKSHMAFEGYSPDTHYIKNLNEEWWDGYTGQPTVIINEFRGQIRFSELLDLVDKWPKQVKWRCRESVPFLAKKVIITSIFAPADCYKNSTDEEPWTQFNRRFKVFNLSPQKCSEGNNRTSEPKKKIAWPIEVLDF